MNPEQIPAATSLAELGWGEPFATAFAAHEALGRQPGRVVAEDRGLYLVASPGGEVRAAVSGRFRFDAGPDPAAFPAVGDWVALDVRDDGGTIHALLPRRTAFSRLAAGLETYQQVVGANVDLVFVVTSLNREFNVRRLERYVAAVWESGARPIVILSKADLAEDVDAQRLAAEASAPGVPIIVESAIDGTGIEDARAHLAPGRTVAVVGSSGVGKSTLINALAGHDVQAVSDVRLDDARGRHTTTRRHLLVLEGAGLILDTPGMREFALLDDAGLATSFADVETAAATCRFSDCAHRTEPGCGVRTAIETGVLDAGRFEAFEKLGREAAYAERRVNAGARIEEQRRWKQIHKNARAHMKQRYGDAR